MSVFSMSAFIDYGNAAINESKNNTNAELMSAFRADLKKNIAACGYPSKDEIGVVDECKDLTWDNTLKQVPNLVSNFINDTGRKFNLPAPNDNCASATIDIRTKAEKTKNGTTKLGGTEKPWTKTIGEHDEFKVSNNTKSFIK